MEFVADGVSTTAEKFDADRPRPVDRRSRKHRRIEPYAWLAAGAVGVGIAAALAGAGVAYADDTGSSTSASSSASADTGPAKNRSGSPGASAGGKADTKADTKADAVRPSNGNKGSDDKDSKSSKGSKNKDSVDKSDVDSKAEDEASESEVDERDVTNSETDEISSNAGGGASEPAPAQPVSTANSSDLPTNSATNQTASLTARSADTARASLTVTVTDNGAVQTAQTAAPAPVTLAGLLKALFLKWQQTYSNQTPTAQPGQNSGQPGDEAVTGTVPATNGEGDPVKGQTNAATPGTTATVPSKYDAGLSDPFLMPTAPSGRTYNVRDYGATSNWSLNDDAAAIQKAINAAQAGDVVYIPNGSYHLKSIISLKSGVSLIGQSRASTVLSAAFSSSPHAVIYGAPGVNNLTLSSFRITVSRGKIKAGIRLGSEGGVQVSNIAVKDIQIEKFERFGVQLQNAYQVLVEGNVIKNATALGGGGSGYGIIIDQSLSSNNWIKNNTIGPVIRHAILIQESAHNNLIELNKITGTVSGAIDLHGEDEYANEIRYNTISNGVRNGTTVSPNGAGIEIGEYSGVIGTETMHDNSGPLNWIHHNTVYNYSMGLRITNNSNYTFIEDNIFYNNRDGGIQADLAPLNNLYISNNHIYNNGSGIILYDVTNAVLQNNNVHDNKNYGIWANPGTTGYNISGNTVTKNKVNITLSSPNGSYVSPV